MSNARLRENFTSAATGAVAGVSFLYSASAIVYAAHGDFAGSVVRAAVGLGFGLWAYGMFTRQDALGSLNKNFCAAAAGLVVGTLGIASFAQNPFAKSQDQQPQSKLVAPAATPAPSAPTR
jgi:hypothetical protein